MEAMTIKWNDTISMNLTIAMEFYLKNGMFDSFSPTNLDRTETVQVSAFCTEVFLAWKELSLERTRKFALIEDQEGNRSIECSSDNAIWLIQRLQSVGGLPTEDEMVAEINKIDNYNANN